MVKASVLYTEDAWVQSPPFGQRREYNINMPYNVQRSGSRYEVVQSQTGRVVGTHPTKEEANAQLGALYANVQDAKKSDDFSSEPYPDRNAANNVAQIAYSSPPGITNVDTINRLKEIINGSDSNRGPQKAEQPTQNNWMGHFFPRRM